MWDLQRAAIVFRQLLIEHPAVHRFGMAALGRVLAGHGLELDLSEATFRAAGHLDPGPAGSLAGESWTVDLLDEAMVRGLAGAEGGELGAVENV